MRSQRPLLSTRRGPTARKSTWITPNYYLIGEVKNTYCTTKDKYGLTVSVEDGSTWIVDKTSYVTGLIIADGASVKAPDGGSPQYR